MKESSMTSTSSDVSIGEPVIQGRLSWLRNPWPEQWNLDLKLRFPSGKKHKRKPHTEQPKVVVSRSPKRWVLPIIIHVIPILSCITIAAINLKGYFVGTEFVGVSNDQSQSTALFSLQITAKALEIFVIGSLGLIVLDVVHYFLLFDDTGLPFSLVGARLTFNDLSYLASPSFWSGINALRSFPRRIIVAFLLVSCGVLATFIGPAAALLLIPSNNPVWPAGGLRFSIPQGKSELWPMQLNASHIGANYCASPLKTTVLSPPIQISDCLWYAGQDLAADLLHGQLLPFGSVQSADMALNRDISWSTYDMKAIKNQYITSCTIWTWSGMSVANVLSTYLFIDWIYAVEGVTNLDNFHELRQLPISHGRYPFRDPDGDHIMLPGMLAPSARAHCLGGQQNFSTLTVLPYPAIPETGSYISDTNATFLIPTSMVQNTSIIRTFWVPKPTVKPDIQNGQDNERDTMPLPSAFLMIQIPTESESAGFVFTCSIDARWIMNATQLMHPFDSSELLQQQDAPSTYTEISAATFDTQGRPGIAEVSPRVDFDISWLEQLTPTFNETLSETNMSRVSPGYTSLAMSMSAASFEKTFTEAPDSKANRLELLIAALAVDGMARINSNNFRSWLVAEDWVLQDNTATDPGILLAGAGGTNQIPQTTSETSYSEYLWTITISGYAYAIESTGDVLALVVILIYMIFALGHICFILYKKWFSLDWWSVMDMIALSQNSPPSDLLKNTSGGIEMISTSRLLLRLRAQDVSLGDRESLHVLISKDKDDPNYRGPSGYHKIEEEKAYY